MLATGLLINIIAIRNTTWSEQKELQEDSVFSSGNVRMSATSLALLIYLGNRNPTTFSELHAHV